MPEFPEFFKRIYDTTGIPERQVLNGISVLTPSFTNLMIYGHRESSGDTHHDHVLARRGRAYAECFSVACPEGEVGSVDILDVTPITKEEFEEAKNRKWINP